MEQWSSRRDLAARHGVDESTIHRWEKAGKVVRFERPNRHPVFRVTGQAAQAAPQVVHPDNRDAPQVVHRALQVVHPPSVTTRKVVHRAPQVVHRAPQAVHRAPQVVHHEAASPAVIRDVVADVLRLQAKELSSRPTAHVPTASLPTWAGFALLCLPFGGITWWAIRDAKKRQNERKFRRQLQQQLAQRKLLQQRKILPMHQHRQAR